MLPSTPSIVNNIRSPKTGSGLVEKAEAAQSEEVSSTDGPKPRIIDAAASLDVLQYINEVKNPNSKNAEKSVSKIKENQSRKKLFLTLKGYGMFLSFSAITD